MDVPHTLETSQAYNVHMAPQLALLECPGQGAVEEHHTTSCSWPHFLA